MIMINIKYSVQANKINPYNIYSFALLPNGEQPMWSYK